MKKWYIFLQMTNAVMIGSILAPIWIDEYYWFYMDLLHIIALLLFVIFFYIIGKKQTKEFERLSKEAIMTYNTLEFHSRLLPWISVDKALPKEGEVVYIAFRDKTGFGVNVATLTPKPVLSRNAIYTTSPSLGRALSTLIHGSSLE